MDAEAVKDIFSAFGPVRVKRMFGGLGIYADETIFAIVAEGELFLKADTETCRDFEQEGCAPFGYETKDGRKAVMSYWRVPERLLDDVDELAQWARKALAVARAAAQAKPPKRPRKSKTPDNKPGV